MGTASLTLGLLGSAVALVPAIHPVAWPIVIVGLVLGTLGVLRVGAGVADNRGVAAGGIASSAAGVVVCVGWLLLTGIGKEESAPASTPTVGGALSTPATADSLVPPVVAEESSGHSIGMTVDVDGLVLTAGPLMRTTGPSGPLVCSTIVYQNDTGAQVGYNGLFDWKLQTPDGATENVQPSGGARRLGSGDLTPGGKVAGNVCFDDPGLSGDHVVVHDVLTPGPSTGTRWTAVL